MAECTLLVISALTRPTKGFSANEKSNHILATAGNIRSSSQTKTDQTSKSNCCNPAHKGHGRRTRSVLTTGRVFFSPRFLASKKLTRGKMMEMKIQKFLASFFT
jgi:hypothetical protein